MMTQDITAHRLGGLADLLQAPAVSSMRERLAKQPAPSPVLVYWALFCASASMAIIHFFVGTSLGIVSTALTLGSCVTCGYGWLLSRSLFQPNPRHEPLAISLVAFLYLTVVVVIVARMAGVDDWALIKITSSFSSLLSSTVLVLAIIEVANGVSKTMDKNELRFRGAFLAGYGALLGGGVILFRSSLDIPGLENWKDAGQTFCAFLALAGASAAARYRLAHPLTAPRATLKRAKVSHDVDPALRQRIEMALVERRAFLEPDLKVADLAQRLGVPEYKVSQCVTSGFGFANFNQLLNHHRLEEAKRRLADPAEARIPILTIALESGFGSIGPFNRAFKAQVGMTPGAFRTKSADERGPDA